MSKYLKIAVAALVAVAMAAPAFADSTISGYFRNQFMMDNISQRGDEDASADSQIDQRLRVKYTNNLNEYVSFTYYGEVDTKWGQASKGAIGGGGKAGADGVNVETKNVYLDVTIPDSIWAVRTGIQGYGIGPAGIVEGNDLAGIRISHVLAPNINLTTAYFKAYENDTVEWDDQDLWSLKGEFKLNDMTKLNADLTWLDINSVSGDQFSVANRLAGQPELAAGAFDDANIYVLDAGANVDLGMANLDLFAAYSGGTANGFGAQDDVDLAGWMATGKVTGDLGMAEAGLRLTYYSADDDLADDEVNVFAGDLTGGAFEFYGENLMIFYSDIYYNNTAGGRIALTDAAYTGNGLFAVNATADFELPNAMYLKTGAGYFSAIEENGAADTDLGIEVAARLGKKIADKVDVSLNGAYAFLGDFYKSNPTLGTSNDPDDIYKLNFVVNVPY